MKAHFKYIFRSSINTRGGVFAVILAMMLVFIALSSLDLFPLAAQITAVSLGGLAIAVMSVVNIVDDIVIIRRMFSAPGAYLLALTPAPRRKTLLASVVAMMAMDIVTMAIVISGEVWLALMLAGEVSGNALRVAFDAIRILDIPVLLYTIFGAFMLAAGYLLVMMTILFCITVKKSILYKKPASGFMTALLACGCIYVFSLLGILMAPFGTVRSHGMFINITLVSELMPAYALLLLLEAAGLFIITSRLLERKMNI